jgi:hypothetical protein
MDIGVRQNRDQIQELQHVNFILTKKTHTHTMKSSTHISKSVNKLLSIQLETTQLFYKVKESKN